MSRRSTLKRRRERRRRKYYHKKKALPLLRVSTAAIFVELDRRMHIIAEVLGEQGN